MQQKFFLYARKSTDVEDKQVLSIEAQIIELRTFAKQENLSIAQVFIEKQSAKIPGRPVFNEMLKRIENGEAAGILAWHPDRLARNSVDGGKIIYFIDCGRIESLKFPQFWFEPTPQGKFMLNIAFGQSKYYVDSLSENTKRGLRQKVRRGEYPSVAPIGYINDIRSKTIVVDKKKSKIIKAAFEFYAEGNARLEDISNFLAQKEILSRNGKRIHKDRITFILKNPFYYGHFRYGGELHEGKHEPIIAKKLFDRVQEVLKERGKPRKQSKNKPKAFCGLLSCSECDMMITAEVQKGHTYYRCTKKSKTINCTQPYIREEELNKQLSALIQKVSLPQDWATELLKMAQDDEKESTQSCSAFVQEGQKKILKIGTQIQRLMDVYLEQDIDREEYRVRKAELMSKKKTLEEKIITLEQKQNDWLEPFREWINTAQNAPKIARDEALFPKKALAKEIFGSNLRLAEKRTQISQPENGLNESNTEWQALQFARKMEGEIPKSQIMVPGEGLEPSLPKERDFKSLVSTDSTIQAKFLTSSSILVNFFVQGNL